MSLDVQTECAHEGHFLDEIHLFSFWKCMTFTAKSSYEDGIEQFGDFASEDMPFSKNEKNNIVTPTHMIVKPLQWQESCRYHYDLTLASIAVVVVVFVAVIVVRVISSPMSHQGDVRSTDAYPTCDYPYRRMPEEEHKNGMWFNPQ